MPDALTVYFDYTCGYSYKALRWLERVRAARPGLSIAWATFSLKEVNRGAEEPSFLAADAPPSLSVLALALAHAARGGDFERFHRATFDAFHEEGRRLEAPDLIAVAAEAGVDVAAFAADEGARIAEVGAEHREAVTHWGVFGTPTLVFEGVAAFVRLREVPGSDDQALGLLSALDRIASSEADLVEIFRPEGIKPTPIQIGPPSG